MKEEVEEFSLKIEGMVKKLDIPYMEAIIQHCEDTELEIIMVGKLISSSIKQKLQAEFEDLHYLPKSNTTKLPF